MWLTLQTRVINAQIKALIEQIHCVKMAKEVRSQSEVFGVCLYMRRKKKIHSLFSLLIYRTCSESNTIFAPLCSTLFRALRKEATLSLSWIASVAESRPLIFITLYQVDQRVLVWLTFTTLASSLPHYRRSQNSHMLVSKATNQDLCPGRVDRRWIEEHETVAALTKRQYLFLLDCCNISCVL